MLPLREQSSAISERRDYSAASRRCIRMLMARRKDDDVLPSGLKPLSAIRSTLSGSLLDQDDRLIRRVYSAISPMAVEM